MNTFFKVLRIFGIVCFIGMFAAMGFMFIHPVDQWMNYQQYIWYFTIGGFVGVFGGLFGGMATGAATKSKLRSSGIPTIGTVVSAQPTGTTMNEQPELAIQMQFELPDGQTVTGETRQIISVAQLAMIQPGMALPIRYDAANPQSIALDPNMDQSVMQDAYNKILIKQGVTSQETLDIVKNGIQAKGVIITSIPTGRIVQDNPEIELDIKVTKSDGGTYETKIAKVVPQTAISKVQPGAVVGVYYMPDDEKKIAISMSAA